MKAPMTFAAVAAMALTARADIIPTQGTQEMHGSVQAYVLAQLVDSQSFNVSAPNPLTSWSPAAQNITATGGIVQSNVTASYSSSIGPGSVTLATHAAPSMSGGSSANTGSLDYTQTFTLRFLIDAPGMYDLAASITRTNPTGWAASFHATLTFGADSQAPIISLDNDGVRPFTYAVSYGPASLFLNAGAYTIQATDADLWSGPHQYMRDSSMNFSLAAIPAPPVPLGILALALLARRGR